MKKNWTLLTLLLLHFATIFAQSYSVKSPDGNIVVKVRVADKFYYSVLYRGQILLNEAPVALVLDNNNELVNTPKVVITESQKGKDTIKPILPTKRSLINAEYNEFWCITKSKFYFVVRAYNNGAAYRWEYYGSGGSNYKVLNEEVNFKFAALDTCYFQREDSMYSHNERVAEVLTDLQITPKKLGSLPMYVKSGNTRIVISESDLYNYAGLWLKGTDIGGFEGAFPYYPKTEVATSDRDMKITAREQYISEHSGQHSFPWRVIAIGDDDKSILNNQLVYQLNRPAKQNFTWVKPGKVAWDWWNNLNVTGVDFKVGTNTETYKYYIDFAAKNGLEYINLDEGWYDVKKNDVTQPIADINLKELVSYAQKKNVGIILWVSWLGLDKRLNAALDMYKSLGIKGIKVDYMQRDDQKMVQFYEKVAKACAERQLFVNFHGSYKPTGMEREYPNIISREGVYGLEQCKWDKDKKISPEHNLTIPFLRMFAGVMDYTPGAMQNEIDKKWQPNYFKPSSLGTRCHQLAMYIIYESPLQMLCDAPAHYEKEKECLDFIKKIPTVWSETLIKEAKISDYIVLARKAMNEDWYVAAMTDWTARSFRLHFDFLDENTTYEVEYFQDGLNADNYANDYKKITRTIIKNEVMTINLEKGGGFVMRLTKKK